MKIKTRKKTRGEKPQKQSLTNKYGNGNDPLYIDEFSELSNEEIAQSIIPRGSISVSGDAHKIVKDSAVPRLLDAFEYNGPIPIGFRTPVPSHFSAFKGPMGRALKHFGARNFYLGDQINAWFDQNCFVNKADTMPGEDAVSTGYDFTPRERRTRNS